MFEPWQGLPPVEKQGLINTKEQTRIKKFIYTAKQEINSDFANKLAEALFLSKSDSEEAKIVSKYNFAKSLDREAKNLMKEYRFVEANIYDAASLMNNPANKKSPYYDSQFEKKFPQSAKLKTSADSKISTTVFRKVFNIELILGIS